MKLKKEKVFTKSRDLPLGFSYYISIYIALYSPEIQMYSSNNRGLFDTFKPIMGGYLTLFKIGLSPRAIRVEDTFGLENTLYNLVLQFHNSYRVFCISIKN